MARKWIAPLVSPMILALTLTGCGASDPATSTSETPDETTNSGSGPLVVGTAPTLRPLEYVNEDNEVTGFVIDLIDAVGEEIGREVEYQRMSFDGFIPAVQADRIDMVTSMGDLPERRDVITFIDYMESGAALLVPDGNPANVEGPEDLCGLNVGFAKGAAQQAFTQQASDECVEEGKQEITLAAYDSGSEAVLALRSGQADAAWTDLVNASYVMNETPGTFEIAYRDPGYGYGIGIPKENEELREKFFAALKTLRENGTYAQLAAEYGLKQAMIDEFTINRGKGVGIPKNPVEDPS